MFTNIWDKITGTTVTATAPAQDPPVTPPPVDPSAPPPPPAPIDIGAVLTKLAAEHPDTSSLDWQHSVVDLLKLLGLPSDPAARQDLSAELNVTTDEPGSAEHNTALYNALIAALEKHGGTVPDSLKAHHAPASTPTP